MAEKAPASARTLGVAIVALAISVSSIALDNPKTQLPGLILPYFSGAANYEWGRGWMYDRSELAPFEALSRADQDAYRFRRSENVEPYDYQERGYVFVALAARTLFFWQGDFKAVESLQVLAHIAVTLFIMAVLRDRVRAILFLLLYGLNPLVIYFATFPLYYFWQSIPAALLLPYLLDRDFRYGRWAPVVIVALAGLHLVRPTMLFVSLLLLVLLVTRETRGATVASLATLAACLLSIAVAIQGPRMNPWHSAYLGVGAYPNPYVQELGDRTAYRVFERETGIDLRGAMIENDRREGLWDDYRDSTRRAYLEILRESPLLLARNAVLNMLQTFSIGYMTRSLTLSYLSSFVGLVYLVLLAVRRRWLFIFAIGCASASFAIYHPPVPAYMCGSYVLLVGAFIDLVKDLPLERWAGRLPIPLLNR